MKKLILINIVLLILLNILPNNKVITPVETTQIVETVETTITSRASIDRVEQQEEKTPITGISEQGLNYIKSKEASVQDTYVAYKNDGEQFYTIGFGHYGADVKEGQTITLADAEQLLQSDITGTANYVLSYCSYLDLTQNEADALISFAYNLGCGWLQTLTANKTRSKQEIAEHWTAYTSKNDLYKQGLLQRRQEELQIFLGGEY